MEGLGGPVDIDQYSRDVADPALEDCCRREVCEKGRPRQWHSFAAFGHQIPINFVARILLTDLHYTVCLSFLLGRWKSQIQCHDRNTSAA